MPGEKPDVLLMGAKKPVIVGGLSSEVNLHPLEDAKDKDAFLNSIAGKVRAIAVSLTAHKIDADLMQRFPKLELVSTFGVGYDHVDAKWAGAHGITVTNTPGVLNEEVADTALGLLLSTVRELPQAERYLRAGKWPSGNYPLTNRCATAPSAWWAWDGSARRLHGASRRSACRLSITAAPRSRA